MMTSSRLRFSYWSDPLCVWAFVAEPRLQALLTEYGDVVDIEYRVVPVFGSVPWRFAHGSWAAKGPSGRRDATRDIARRFGHDDVTGDVWVQDPPASSWAPCMAIKAAFALVEEAIVSRDAAVCFQRRLRERFFLQNVNIARLPAQMEVAAECALPEAAL
ncbi:MAG: DsbA family protein [Deltaproteobacteria bacterium]|nr:DsbA family protein [Deltaproteobacteria bacterium]